MMELTLDGRKLEPSSFNARTLAELIRQIELLLAPERVIVSLTLNGETLDRGRERARAAEPLESLANLEVGSLEVHELARNTLASLIEYLPALSLAVDACVAAFQSGDESEGHRLLAVVIDGLQMVAGAWNGIACFLGTGGTEPPAVPDLDGLNQLLRPLVEAQEHQDTVSLCDILESQLVPLLEDWRHQALALREPEAE